MRKTIFVKIAILLFCFNGSLLSKSLEVDNHPDLQALLDLYNTMGGEDWKYQEGWLAASTGENCDPCNYNGSPWSGITCENDRVTELSLYDYGLIGSLPESIGQLDQLEDIQLAVNEIEGSLPESIGNLKELKYFSIYGNKLSGPIPTSITNLKKLRRIFFSYNKITGSIPQNIAEMESLRDIWLNQNLMSGELPQGLTNLKNLNTLNIADNQYTGEIPYGFGNIPTMQEIIINDCNLTGSIPADLGKMTNLNFLRLHNNNLEGCFPSTLKALCNVVPTVNFLGNPLLENDNWDLFCSNNDGKCTNDCAHVDYEPLMSFYLSTNGPNWINKNGWEDGANNTNCDPCSWYGVDCNASGRVICIDLDGIMDCEKSESQGNGLSGELTESIGQFGEMNFFSLSNNNVGGILPVNMKFLTMLEELWLDNNNFEGKLSNDLGCLVGMEEFHLNNNNFEGNLPEILKGFPNLVYADFSENNFSGCFPAEYQLYCQSGIINTINNPKLPYLGDFEQLCQDNIEFENQTNTPCDDGDNSTVNDVIDENCNCGKEDPNSIKEIAFKFKMYPNPVVNDLTIEAGGRFNIKIYALDGSLLFENEKYNSYLLDLSHLKSGIYTIILSNENSISSKKIIKL